MRVVRVLAAASLGVLAVSSAVGLPAGSPAYAQDGGPTYAQGGEPAYAQDGGPAHAQDGGPAYAQGGEAAYAQDGGEVVETEYGPLGPGDRDFLVRIRYAGLWEVPAGEMAAERGTTEPVREIGRFIADEHTDLDQQVREVAATLGVPLPREPFAQHQSWLDQIDRQTGEDFDREFIQLLREAHGQVYPLIAYARAGTQNTLVRDFADVAEEFISRHMNYLESSGLVDWVHIPPPPEPAGAQSRFLASEPAGVNPILVWLLLGVAAVTGVVAVVRTVRPR